MPGEVGDWTDVYEAHLDIYAMTPDRDSAWDDGDKDAITVVRLFVTPDRD